ncbi:MAG: hypothetical protein HC939_06940 [Pleurocapsa sp. SU_5_0]|nr:hypothetical protein [Pleurocapsa sp. SU_5_0]NJR46519.1 hypothetical protein [Hyellaceae cyanobacterium CSU_1_1]
MSEYTEVEQPFLQQLQTLGWQIIDQGVGIPSDSKKSLRVNFRQWLPSTARRLPPCGLRHYHLWGRTLLSLENPVSPG